MSDSPHEFIEKLRLENKALRRAVIETTAENERMKAALVKIGLLSPSNEDEAADDFCTARGIARETLSKA